ncbi:hypothetical protein ACI2LM_32845 [Paenibacillus lautus]|uniref:hypothetical protein n=1 Tax=Paenibacillus lautus TaxID=1401 RepID=UPI0038505E62
MFYEQVEKIENYLSKKRKTPQHIKDARTHLYLYAKEAIQNGENYKDELRIIRTHYHGQLASAPTMANYLSIAAIIISLIIGMFSLNPSLGQNIRLFFSIVAPLILVSLVLLVLSNFLINKKSVVYTIIIQLIDEVLEN